MLSPILIASTDAGHQLLVMTVEGPLVDPDHVEPLRMVLSAVPAGHSLIIDLTEATEFSDAALDNLRRVALEATSLGQTMIIVCGSLARRTELVLADIDSLAPVVAALEDALPLAHAAA